MSSTAAPSRVAFPTAAAQDFFKVTAGKNHGCALSVTGHASGGASGTDYVGAAFCWGDNAFGKVGQSYNAQWLTPAEVHFQ